MYRWGGGREEEEEEEEAYKGCERGQRRRSSAGHAGVYAFFFSLSISLIFSVNLAGENFLPNA